MPYRAQAGKTGTTDNHTDAWFCGYTPNLAACVWVGYPKGEISMSNLGGTIPGPAFGGGYPATIWRLFAAAAFQSRAEQVPADAVAGAAAAPDPVPAVDVKFQLPVATTKKKKQGQGGGGSSQGGGSTTGGGSSGPPPPTSTTTPPPPTTTGPPST